MPRPRLIALFANDDIKAFIGVILMSSICGALSSASMVNGVIERWHIGQLLRGIEKAVGKVVPVHSPLLVRSYMIAIGVDPSLRLSEKGVTKDNPRDLTNFYSRVRFSHSRLRFYSLQARERRFGWKGRRKRRIGVSRGTNALETKYSSLHSCAKEWKDSVA